MNRECGAEYFYRWGKKWGRCFWDGTIFPILNRKKLPKICPNCERPLDCNEMKEDPGRYDEILIQVDIPYYQNKIKELEQKVRNLRNFIYQNDDTISFTGG